MDLWVREARLFKYGSGTGSNFSNIAARCRRAPFGRWAVFGSDVASCASATVRRARSSRAARRAAPPRWCASISITRTSRTSSSTGRRGRAQGRGTGHRLTSAATAGAPDGRLLRRRVSMSRLTASGPVCRIRAATRAAPKPCVEGPRRGRRARRRSAARAAARRVRATSELDPIEQYDTDWDERGLLHGLGAELQQQRSGSPTRSSTRSTRRATGRARPSHRRRVNGQEGWRLRELWDGSALRRLGVRRPGPAVRRHDQRVAHLPRPGRINASNPCSEYMFLDDTACNLASLNLVRFLGRDGSSTSTPSARRPDVDHRARDLGAHGEFPSRRSPS